jgi:hypothetical protein
MQHHLPKEPIMQTYLTGKTRYKGSKSMAYSIQWKGNHFPFYQVNRSITPQLFERASDEHGSKLNTYRDICIFDVRHF